MTKSQKKKLFQTVSLLLWIIDSRCYKKLTYRLENRASASCFRLIIMLMNENLVFLSFVVRYVWDVFFIYGNECMHASLQE